MLSTMQMQSACLTKESMAQIQQFSPYDRNERDDMKKAIELLYDFKKGLSELHPNCLHLIENMLQKNTRY